MYKRGIKYGIDFILASAVFIVLLPFFLLIAFILFIANNGSPFFFQLRPGKDEVIFKLIKFKTMNDKKDSKGDLLPDSDRLTAIGRWVRKLSMDEIPQLLNVINGDMSLIGPRPLLIEYLPLYNEDQKQRHNMRPGITGWAQINGRNTISWKQKFEYDVWYVKNCTVWLDIKILMLTLFKVIKSEGISSETSSTMEKFTGTFS
jgi:undecaprenyl phosphate N,N'-diacetylbacillosamine 1-phosphate transferase